MASWYMSYTAAGGDHSFVKEPDHTGTSSTSTDEVELRILSSGSPVPTKLDVIVSLERFIRWLEQGGQHEAGANQPPS